MTIIPKVGCNGGGGNRKPTVYGGSLGGGGGGGGADSRRQTHDTVVDNGDWVTVFGLCPNNSELIS